MKIIIHAPKDKMILAARAALVGLGHEERGDWPTDKTLLREFENGDLFFVRRNTNSITVVWQ